MKQAHVFLQSTSPYGQSRQHGLVQKDRESTDDFQIRTFRESLHVDTDGFVYIPPMQFKKCLDSTAAYAKIKVPGQRNVTYMQYFKRGVLVAEGIKLPLKKEDVQPTIVQTEVKGGVRIPKYIPVIDRWEGMFTAMILDDVITEPIFAKHMHMAGQFTGLGTWRPANGGLWGRFVVKEIVFEEIE